jgi:hypothetical protein
MIEDDPGTLLDRLAAFEPPRVGKWLERDRNVAEGSRPT